jgi:predicted HD phosphohydrolase
VARENGLDEMVITACLLHDIAVIALLSAGRCREAALEPNSSMTSTKLPLAMHGST